MSAWTGARGHSGPHLLGSPWSDEWPVLLTENSQTPCGGGKGGCLQLWGQSSGVWLVGLFLSSRKAVASNHMLSWAVISSRGPDGFVCRLDTWVSCMCIWKWCHELPCRSWRILLHRWRERSEFHKLPSVLSEEKQRRLCGVCACDTTTSPQVGEFPAKQTRLVIAS